MKQKIVYGLENSATAERIRPHWLKFVNCLGLYWGFFGIMEKDMETTISRLGFRVGKL